MIMLVGLKIAYLIITHPFAYPRCLRGHDSSKKNRQKNFWMNVPSEILLLCQPARNRARGKV